MDRGGSEARRSHGVEPTVHDDHDGGNAGDAPRCVCTTSPCFSDGDNSDGGATIQ